MTTEQSSKPEKPRPERFVSHALVEVRRFKTLPFFVQSGILLDMSTAGIKVEFTSNNVSLKAGDLRWLHIPMAPLGLRGMKDLICQVDIRWFDRASARMGGVFTQMDPVSQMLVEQIVQRLRESGNRI